jgi:thiamine biosynthesis lipoprotein
MRLSLNNNGGDLNLCCLHPLSVSTHLTPTPPTMPAIKRCRPLLGTFVEISIRDDRQPPHVLHGLAEIAFGRIARVQSLMSFHDPASELSRLNACGHLHPLPVNGWTREVIAEAVRLGRASEGIFDIAAARASMPWGLLPKPAVEGGTPPGTYRDIVLHRDGRVSFRRPLMLDLGGIAKGFAVDKAAELLAEQGVHQAVINAGGDLRFIGARPASLPIRDPAAPHSIHLFAQVTAPAVATSAAYLANRRHHWRKVSHILHPRTRKPMRSNVSVSVFAQSCVQANALTKAVLFDEPQCWESLLAKEDASAVLVTAKGEMVRFPAAAA